MKRLGLTFSILERRFLNSRGELSCLQIHGKCEEEAKTLAAEMLVVVHCCFLHCFRVVAIHGKNGTPRIMKSSVIVAVLTVN